MLYIFNNKWAVRAGGRGNVFVDGGQDSLPPEHPTRPRCQAAVQHVRLGDLWSVSPPENCCGTSSVDDLFCSHAPLLWGSCQTVILLEKIIKKGGRGISPLILLAASGWVTANF